MGILEPQNAQAQKLRSTDPGLAATVQDVTEVAELGNFGQLDLFRGREIDTAGDGFLAVFDGPERAVRYAQAIGAAIREIGPEIRAGCHTGEVELVGDGVRGIAVHIAARVTALAGPGEVLVSSTVKDLVAGSVRPHVRRRRRAHAEGCPRRLAPIPSGGRGPQASTAGA